MCVSPTLRLGPGAVTTGAVAFFENEFRNGFGSVQFRSRNLRILVRDSGCVFGEQCDHEIRCVFRKVVDEVGDTVRIDRLEESSSMNGTC